MKEFLTCRRHPLRPVNLCFVGQDALSSSEASDHILIVKRNLQRRLGITSPILVQLFVAGGGLVEGDQVLLLVSCKHVVSLFRWRPLLSAARIDTGK